MEIQEKNEKTKMLIKETIQELVTQMGIVCEVEVREELDERGELSFLGNIKTNESNFLIGQYGVNLQALQHIGRLLIRKKIIECRNFILDVNFYRQEKNSSIIKLAQEMAQQALREKRAVVLRPMTPYERRIVHMELAQNKQLKTESIGEGENRKVVIRPAEMD